MKTPVIYSTNILRLQTLHDLRQKLGELQKDKFFIGFIMGELAVRHDTILEDESISAEGKVEALKQIASLTSLFSSNTMELIDGLIRRKVAGDNPERIKRGITSDFIKETMKTK